MENNVFAMLKAQVIPDVEFAYDALIKVLDKLHEAHPDLKLSTVGSPMHIVISAKFNIGGRDYACNMHVQETYANGTNVACVVLHEHVPCNSSYPTTGTSVYAQDLKQAADVEVPVYMQPSPVSRLNTICMIDYGKKYKNILKYDKDIEKYGNTAMYDWIDGIIRDIDKEMDAGGIPINLELDSKRRHEYDDDYCEDC